MPRLTKIATRQGDGGQTSLSGGQRVPKDERRVAAYGVVDELNSHLGLALALGLSERNREIVLRMQNDLFNLGSDLSFLEEDKAKYDLPLVESRHVQALDEIIEEMAAELGPLQNFILPGGTQGAAQLHIARTVCRRAEREVVALARDEQVGPHVIPYLNRLSDALFVLARFENRSQGDAEALWDSRI